MRLESSLRTRGITLFATFALLAFVATPLAAGELFNSGTPGTGTYDSSMSNSVRYASRFTPTVDGNVDNIRVYGRRKSGMFTGAFAVALFDEAGGAPGVQLASGTGNFGDTAAWVEVSIASTPVVTTSNYYIVWYSLTLDNLGWNRSTSSSVQTPTFSSPDYGTTWNAVSSFFQSMVIVDNSPTAVSDSFAATEDTTLNEAAPGVLGNDTDPNGDSLITALVSTTTHGSLTLNSNGSFHYTPNPDYFGTDSFIYRAWDGALYSNPVTVTLTIAGTPDAPVAVADSHSTNEDTALNISAPGLLSNDLDADGDLLTAVLVTDVSNGTLSLNADGSFLYTPAANYSGADSFTYKANDGLADSNTVTVSITVNAVNDAPIAVADSYNFDEDTVLNVSAPGVLANDSDVELDGFTAILVAGPASGVLNLNADGSFDYTPVANFTGVVSFNYKANDGADSNIVTVTIAVNPVNDAPVALLDNYATPQETPLSFAAFSGVLANDSDIDGDTLTAILVADVSNGDLELDPDGGFMYTPGVGFSGTDSFTYKANDGALDSNTVTVTITVNASNHGPTATPDSYSTNEDTVLNVAAAGVLANDSDPESDPITAVQVTGPAHGLLTLNADGSFDYTPDANYFGSDSFTYKATDGGLDSNIVVVTLTINPVNDAPVAVVDSHSVNEDNVLNVSAPGVLGNDTDIESEPLTAILVADVSNGVLVLNSDGSFTYTPAANFNGADSFTYKANDGTDDSNTVTVSITINAVNDAPVAVADSHSVNEDGVLNVGAPGVLTNDTDVEASPLTAILVDDVAHGSLTLNADGSFDYTPDADYFGSDSFTYKANDGTDDSNTVTVTITVNPVNDAPVAAADSYVVDEDNVLGVGAPGVLGNDSDTEGDTLNAVLVTNVSNGLLTLNANGSFNYTPAADFNGADSFTYKANDGTDDSNTVTVTITINAVNDAPDAVADSYVVNEDTLLTVVLPGVLGNDSDTEGSLLTAVLVTDVADGVLILAADGSFTYMPDADFHGVDSFTYMANDGALDSDPVTVTITVSPVNDAPVATADSYATDEDTVLNVSAPGVQANDGDVDGDLLDAILVADVSNGVLSLNLDGSFTYTPAANFNGADSFTYKLNDGAADSNTVTVNITVNPVNDAPVSVADSYAVNEDAVLTIVAPGVLTNDSDVEASPLTTILVDDVLHGVLALAGDGSFVYTPDADYHGADSFTYKVTDGTDESLTVTVTLTINPVNDAPVAVGDTYVTDEDTTLNVSAPGVQANDGDVDGDTLTASVVADVANGVLSLNADGSFSYTPAADFFGADSFTYKLNDGSVDSATVTVSITINAVNDVPAAAADSYGATEDTPLVVAAPGVLANDTDVEASPLTAVLVSNVSNGSLTLNADGSFSYTAAANFNGVDSFTYSANDGTDSSTPVTVTLTVAAVNDAPVALANNYNTNEDTALVISAPGILGNDSDVDGDTLTAVLIANVSDGVLTLNADGSFTYTPNANFNGLDSFTYKANDGTVDSATVAVSILVNAVNDAPVAAGESYVTDEDLPLVVGAPGVLANDTDVEASPLTAVLVSTTANGLLVLNADGSFAYTPNADFNGSDSFTYQANDGTTHSGTVTVNLTVNPINDAPVGAADSYAIDEDGTLNIAAPGVLANDSDVDGDTLTVTLIADVSNGVLSLNADGSFTYTPAAEFNGVDSFTYQATDGALNTAIVTVALTVNAVNDLPVAVADSYVTDEDTPLAVGAPGLLANDSDIDGDTLSAVLVTGPAHGALMLNADGSFSYTPDADYNGSDSFTYEAHDGTAGSGAFTVSLTINAINDAPLGAADAHAIDEDGTLNIAAPGVLGNDTDVDGDTITAVLVANVANGVLVLNADGSFDYTPAANYNGSDSFTYQATDGTLSSAIVTVTLTINAINDVPVATLDSYITDEDTPLNVGAPGVLANDSDIDGDSITAVLVSGTSNGALTLNADGSFDYTPNADFNGSDSFTYEALDGTAASVAVIVTITINAVNDAPVAAADTFVTDEDTVLNVVAPGVLANDTDVESDPLTVALVNDVAHGTLVLNADGSFDYTPAANYNGSDSFTYRINDGLLDSADVTVSITVNAVNDLPVAVADSYVTAEDTALNVSAPGVLANDTDVESSITAILVAGTSNGALTLNADGSFVYTPNANFNGTDSFTYKANDGTADSLTVTVTITVTAVNDAPVAVADTYTTAEDTALNVSAPGVLANDTDVESSPLTAAVVTTTTNGTLTLNADGSFTYTPNANYNGSDSFTYRVNDGGLDSLPVTVGITVTPTNDAPVAVADTYAATEDTQLVVNNGARVLANDTDADGDTLIAILVSNVSNGVLALSPDGSFIYDPNANFNGADSFTYKANDGTADSNTVTVTINVAAVNDAPVAVADAYTTAEDTPLNVTAPGVLSNDTDADNDTMTAVLISGPANGLLTLNTDGSFDYTPGPGYNGVDSFVYRASDATDNSTDTTVTITVTPVNDQPVASPDSYITDEDTALVVDALTGVLFNDMDPDADAITAVLVTDVSNGALTLNADGSFTYTPAADFNGLDSFTYHANDGTLDSVDVTVTITVNAVNDAPSFTKGTNVVVDEDAPAQLIAGWATAISAGPADEAGQSLMFTVTVTSGSALFAAAPAIDALTGDLTFTPAADAWGTAQLEVFLSDNGGGTDASTVETFEITINPIEDAPSYVAGPAVTVLEDSGLHTAAAWATAINHGQGSMIAALTFVVTNNTNAALFAVAPAVDPLTGDLSFTPAADANGTASITLVLEDSGAPITQSPSQTFTITVTAVNDAPTFVAGPRVRWNTKEGPGSIQTWATSILAGPANESAQGLTFLTTIVGGEKLLDAVPAIDGAGNLSFNPSSRANGTAVIAVILMDNGGTANGGVDATAAVTFEIEFNFEQSSSSPEGCTSGSGSGLPWLFASLIAVFGAARLRRKLAVARKE